MKTYTIENLLIGKSYRSASNPDRAGVINTAEKRGNVWAGENAEAYAVRYSDSVNEKQYWATVVVAL
jgi:hypothetical protein